MFKMSKEKGVREKQAKKFATTASFAFALFKSVSDDDYKVTTRTAEQARG